MWRPGYDIGWFSKEPVLLDMFIALPSNYSLDNGAAIWIASSVETNVGIIFTCMHATRPVLAKIVPAFFSTTSGSSKSGGIQGQARSPYFARKCNNSRSRNPSQNFKMDKCITTEDSADANFIFVQPKDHINGEPGTIEAQISPELKSLPMTDERI
jgi:hypothetical protein